MTSEQRDILKQAPEVDLMLFSNLVLLFADLTPRQMVAACQAELKRRAQEMKTEAVPA
jgi:hypothetical protein